MRALHEIAATRGQSLAQMAISWVLRSSAVTTALIGASRPEQITELIEAVHNTAFSAAELAAIDQHAQDGGLNLWARPSQDLAP